MKLLGLDTLASELNTLKNEVLVLADENKELKAELAKVSDSVEAIEDFDADDFVREDDVNDRIESYLNENDYITQSYCDDEIETKVSDAVDEKVTEAIDDLDLESKVKEVVAEMDKASFGDTEEIEQAVSKAVAEVLSKAYNALKKGL